MIQQSIIPEDWNSLLAWARSLMHLLDRARRSVGISVGDEAANVRRFTIQVRNRARNPVAGVHLVRIWISASEHGAPGGTQTLSLVTGTLFQTIASNQAVEILTDSTGKLVLDVTVTGAATRHIEAVVIGEPDGSGEIAWAA